MEREIAFIYEGDQVGDKLDLTIYPRIGEWVQLYVEQQYQTFVVKNVLHKFVRSYGTDELGGKHRIIFIVDKIKEFS